MDGTRDGFRIGFNYSMAKQASIHNMLSAMELPEVVRDYLSKECSKGRELGAPRHSRVPGSSH